MGNVRGSGIETTSASGSTSPVSDIGEGSKKRTIPGAIKTLFKAAVKAVTQCADDKPQPSTRRRRGEKESSGLLMRQVARHVGKSVARGRYAALRTGKTKAGHGTVSLGMETPLDQSGSFNLSLCNSFGGFEDAGGDHGSEVFDAPDASVNLISLGL